MKEIGLALLKLAEKMTPDQIFIYIMILGLFGIILLLIRRIGKFADALQRIAKQNAAATELLRLLVRDGYSRGEDEIS